MKENFKYKKKYGQNFLKDNEIINKIIETAKITKRDLILEIGPGMGALSKKIVPLAGFSILYEIDQRLEKNLLQLLNNNNNYKLLIKDFMKTCLEKDVDGLNCKNIKVVANLPYYITSPILNKLIEEIYPDEIVIMIQKEVAERLCSFPGNKEYGYITVYLNSYYEIEKIIDVDRKKFEPIPNVDSSVIRLKKNNKYIKNRVYFNKLIKDSFKFKRKTLKNNLKEYNLQKIEDILNSYRYSINNRAEEIPLEVFIKISDEMV